MSDCKEVKVVYGWCATRMIVCPEFNPLNSFCPKEYSKCEWFRKAGEHSAVEEINSNGKRRIYFKNFEGLYKDAETGELVRYNPFNKEISHTGISE